MGHAAPTRRPPARAESGTEFWIGVAKDAYVRDIVTLEEFEADIDGLLSGGGFPGHCMPGHGMPRPFATETVAR